MQFIRLIVAFATVFAAISAFAKGNQYINPHEDKCNIQNVPSAGSAYNHVGNKIHYRIARRETLVKAYCQMPEPDPYPELTNAVPFSPETWEANAQTAPDCLIKLQLADFQGYGPGWYEFWTQDFHGTFTPEGKAILQCTCDLSNGACYFNHPPSP